MARNKRQAEKPEAKEPVVQPGPAPTPLANAMPGRTEPGFTVQNTFEHVSKCLAVHRQAALTFCASMSIAFLHAAYLVTGSSRMTIAEVQKALEELCKERGVKRASTFAYLGAAKKLALKITQISGFKADVLGADNAEAATTAVVNTLKGMKASKTDGDYIDSFDALKRFLGMGTGRGAGKKKSAKRQTAAQIEADRKAALSKDAAEGKTTTVPGTDIKVPINVPINSIEVVADTTPQGGEHFIVESLVRHKRDIVAVAIAAIDAIQSKDALAQIAAHILERTNQLTLPVDVQPGAQDTVQPQGAAVQ